MASVYVGYDIAFKLTCHFNLRNELSRYGHYLQVLHSNFYFLSRWQSSLSENLQTASFHLASALPMHPMKYRRSLRAPETFLLMSRETGWAEGHVYPTVNIWHLKIFHMWIPQVNQTVVKTVQSAGFSVARVRLRTGSQLPKLFSQIADFLPWLCGHQGRNLGFLWQ